MSFCIVPGNYIATFSPTSNTIDFSSQSFANPAYTPQVRHEFFHAYQNFTYNGIAAYGKTSSGSNSPGFVNIEFEQVIFSDIVSGNRQAFENGITDQRDQYNQWINGLTNNGTIYPQLIPSTAVYNTFLSMYATFLDQYNQLPNNSNTSDIIPTLLPQAFINLFNSVKANCQL